MEIEEAERFDAQAVASSLAGDTSAYDKLIIKYQRRAVAVSYRLLGNINDAMDVCQEAFIRAYRSLGSLEQPGRFGVVHADCQQPIAQLSPAAQAAIVANDR